MTVLSVRQFNTFTRELLKISPPTLSGSRLDAGRVRGDPVTFSTSPSYLKLKYSSSETGGLCWCLACLINSDSSSIGVSARSSSLGLSINRLNKTCWLLTETVLANTRLVLVSRRRRVFASCQRTVASASLAVSSSGWGSQVLTLRLQGETVVTWCHHWWGTNSTSPGSSNTE